MRSRRGARASLILALRSVMAAMLPCNRPISPSMSSTCDFIRRIVSVALWGQGRVREGVEIDVRVSMLCQITQRTVQTVRCDVVQTV